MQTPLVFLIRIFLPLSNVTSRASTSSLGPLSYHEREKRVRDLSGCKDRRFSGSVVDGCNFDYLLVKTMQKNMIPP